MKEHCRFRGRLVAALPLPPICHSEFLATIAGPLYRAAVLCCLLHKAYRRAAMVAARAAQHRSCSTMLYRKRIIPALCAALVIYHASPYTMSSVPSTNGEAFYLANSSTTNTCTTCTTRPHLHALAYSPLACLNSRWICLCGCYKARRIAPVAVPYPFLRAWIQAAAACADSLFFRLRLRICNCVPFFASCCLVTFCAACFASLPGSASTITAPPFLLLSLSYRSRLRIYRSAQLHLRATVTYSAAHSWTALGNARQQTPLVAPF